MGEDVKDFIKSIENFGFEKVLEIPFTSDYWKQDDCFYAYFHKLYGIFLQFDTFGGKDVNGGYYYYQWRVSKEWVIKQEEKRGCAGYHPCLSSGGFLGDRYTPRPLYEMIWSGDGDCRTSMLHRIESLAKDGTFITPWVKSDGIMAPTLVHYGDHDRHDASWDVGYKAYCDALVTKTPKRFKMLPKYVRDAIVNGMMKERITIKKE